MCRIFAVSIYDFQFSEYQNFKKFIPDADQSIIEKFVQKNDALRAIISILLSRALIAHFCKIPNEKIIITKTKYGKPILQNISGFYFNISHSSDWVVCAVDNVNIGIDIEQIRTIDMEIAKAYFTLEEQSIIFNAPVDKRLFYFYTIWTLKESYIKYTGDGLSAQDLTAFSVLLKNDYADIYKNAIKLPVYLHLFYNFKSYCMSVCSEKNEFPEHPEILTCTEILNYLSSNC